MLVDASDINTELLQNYSENEARFQKLWLAFFDSIAIEARTNPELQAQNIPKRFWKDAVELRHFCEYPYRILLRHPLDLLRCDSF